jgi:transcriptional regulator with XRE-family HTH domain
MPNSEQELAGTTLPSRLREARRHAGFSASLVARKIRVRRAAIHEMESGKRKVSGQELIRLANLYGVSPSWLIDRRSTNTDQELAEMAVQLLLEGGFTNEHFHRLLTVIELVRDRRGLMRRPKSML